MTQEIQKNSYLLLDSRNAPLARGELLTEPDAPTLQVRVLDGKISDVMDHEEIQLVPMGTNGASLLGRIVRSRNDNIMLQKLQSLDNDMRQNLRIPTDFHSFIYPVSGQWRGRRSIEAKDLSCGGVAFFCADSLQVGERVEVIIPVTSQPVILQCKILRERPSEEERTDVLYAGKFVEMCADEEMVVREAVFNIQLQGRPRKPKSGGKTGP